jgi:hypothetical protein
MEFETHPPSSPSYSSSHSHCHHFVSGGRSESRRHLQENTKKDRVGYLLRTSQTQFVYIFSHGEKQGEDYVIERCFYNIVKSKTEFYHLDFDFGVEDRPASKPKLYVAHSQGQGHGQGQGQGHKVAHRTLNPRIVVDSFVKGKRERHTLLVPDMQYTHTFNDELALLIELCTHIPRVSMPPNLKSFLSKRIPQMTTTGLKMQAPSSWYLGL